MRYQTLAVLAISALLTFLLLSLMASGLSAWRRARGRGGSARGPRL